MAVIKIKSPIKMSVDDANEKFYPNAYIMANCEMEEGNFSEGYVVAIAPQGSYGILKNYQRALLKDSSNGEVHMETTKDPLDGGSIFVQQDSLEF